MHRASKTVESEEKKNEIYKICMGVCVCVLQTQNEMMQAMKKWLGYNHIVLHTLLSR